jgi:cytochrome c peroxidase
LTLPAISDVSEQPPSAPQGKSNTPLILALVGAAAAGGGAYYYYGATSTPTEAAKELGTQVDSARAIAENKLGLKRSKDDYQKVYNRIAETLEKDDYDGEFGRLSVRSAVSDRGRADAACDVAQMVPSAPSSSVSLGTRLVPTM